MSKSVTRAAVLRSPPVATAALCLSLAVVAGLGSACATHSGGLPGTAGAGGRPSSGGPGADWRAQTLPATVKVRVGAAAGGRVVTLLLEDYVLGAVRAEVLPSTLRGGLSSPVLEVQAIVSRTYAVANLGRHAAEGYDLCDTTHCQVYRATAAGEGPTDAAARAVKATRARIITFDGRAIQALFHANCGGHTASAASVWGGSSAPYLGSVDDAYCSRRPASAWTFAVDDAALLRALNADARTRLGDRFRRLDVASRDATGRGLAVTLVGSRTISLRAEVFRAVMTQAFGLRSIRSTWFDVGRDGSRWRFKGVGFGHGVGLCQAGTLNRVEAGQSPMEIIEHYFPGTRLQTASTGLVGPDISQRLFNR